MMFSPAPACGCIAERSMVSHSLRHGLDAGKQRDDDKQNKRHREDVEAIIKSSKAGNVRAGRGVLLSAKRGAGSAAVLKLWLYS